MEENDEYKRRLRGITGQKILDARRVWKRSIFWAGFAIVLTGIIAVFVSEAIVDWLMPLPSFVRIALLTVGVGVTGYLLYKYLVQPLRAALHAS